MSINMEEKNTEKEPLIRVENLKKYYPIRGGVITHTTGYVHSVDGVSFSIAEGETLGLVGESGCGKSTVGRQLVGLEKPTGGRLFYQGKDMEKLSGKEKKSVRTQLQMVFQDPYSSLNPRKHIYEILSQPMLYHGTSNKETVHRDVDRLLDMVGLSKHVLGRYPHEFSGGQRQRIGIARALSLNPRFLVCDEPVSALDVSIQAQILNLLRSLQKDLGLTCMFVGHGLGAVNYVSDRIAVMYLGKIVEIGAGAGGVPSSGTPLHPCPDRCSADCRSQKAGTKTASDRRNRLQHEPALRLPFPSEMSVRDGKLQTGSAGALQCFPRQQSSGGVPICNCAAGWRRTRIRCEDAAGCRRAEMEIKVTWENI